MLMFFRAPGYLRMIHIGSTSTVVVSGQNVLDTARIVDV